MVFVSGTTGFDYATMTDHSKWPDIPRKPLMEAVKGRAAHFVRSDSDRDDPGFRCEGDLYVGAAIPIA